MYHCYWEGGPHPSYQYKVIYRGPQNQLRIHFAQNSQDQIRMAQSPCHVSGDYGLFPDLSLLHRSGANGSFGEKYHLQTLRRTVTCWLVAKTKGSESYLEAPGSWGRLQQRKKQLVKVNNGCMQVIINSLWMFFFW